MSEDGKRIVEGLRTAHATLKLGQGFSVGYDVLRQGADEIERLESHVRLLQRDNANLRLLESHHTAEAMRRLVKPDDGTWFKWLMADADRCASVVADAYAHWDPDELWESALKREIWAITG